MVDNDAEAQSEKEGKTAEKKPAKESKEKAEESRRSP